MQRRQINFNTSVHAHQQQTMWREMDHLEFVWCHEFQTVRKPVAMPIAALSVRCCSVASRRICAASCSGVSAVLTYATSHLSSGAVALEEVASVVPIVNDRSCSSLILHVAVGSIFSQGCLENICGGLCLTLLRFRDLIGIWFRKVSCNLTKPYQA